MGCGGSFSLRHAEIPSYVPNENCRQVSFKPGLEPQGFNGIKWGTDLSTLERMNRIKKISNGVGLYLKEGDMFKLGNGRLLPIQYGFWRGKFYIGMVTTESPNDWNALKEVVFQKYGEGAKPFRNKEDYLWTGKIALVALRYDEITKEGIFYIKSESISKQMDDYRAAVK